MCHNNENGEGEGGVEPNKKGLKFLLKKITKPENKNVIYCRIESLDVEIASAFFFSSYCKNVLRSYIV